MGTKVSRETRMLVHPSAAGASRDELSGWLLWTLITYHAFTTSIGRSSPYTLHTS